MIINCTLVLQKSGNEQPFLFTIQPLSGYVYHITCSYVILFIIEFMRNMFSVQMFELITMIINCILAFAKGQQ